ncbi:MAG: hypothetical protein ACYSR5_11990, partial [Planctomycetota bacterium]
MEGRHGAPQRGSCKSRDEAYERFLFLFLFFNEKFFELCPKPSHLGKDAIMKKRSSSDNVMSKQKNKSRKER